MPSDSERTAKVSGESHGYPVNSSTLAEALVKCGLIDAEAIDDPEGYDNALTKTRIEQAARELSLQISVNQKGVL